MGLVKYKEKVCHLKCEKLLDSDLYFFARQQCDLFCQPDKRVDKG